MMTRKDVKDRSEQGSWVGLTRLSVPETRKCKTERRIGCGDAAIETVPILISEAMFFKFLAQSRPKAVQAQAQAKQWK